MPCVVSVTDFYWWTSQHLCPSHSCPGPHIPQLCGRGGMRSTLAPRRADQRIPHPGSSSRVTLVRKRANSRAFDWTTRKTQLAFPCCSWTEYTEIQEFWHCPGTSVAELPKNEVKGKLLTQNRKKPPFLHCLVIQANKFPVYLPPLWVRFLVTDNRRS